MAKSPVHFVSSNESTRTLCGINLIGSSNRKAPICSTNDEHITCPACEARRNAALCDPERFVTTGPHFDKATTVQLRGALGEAQRVYATCGGHKLAARMYDAIANLNAALDERAINEANG